MAQAVAAGESDPWTVACALERHVKTTIRLKNYSTAMATAAEVAQSLEGDCTEHAMLLAALCRARQIPARVAIGLVYYPVRQRLRVPHVDRGLDQGPLDSAGCDLGFGRHRRRPI